MGHSIVVAGRNATCPIWARIRLRHIPIRNVSRASCGVAAGPERDRSMGNARDAEVIRPILMPRRSRPCPQELVAGNEVPECSVLPCWELQGVEAFPRPTRTSPQPSGSCDGSEQGPKTLWISVYAILATGRLHGGHSCCASLLRTGR